MLSAARRLPKRSVLHIHTKEIPMNYLEASNYIFENAQELINQNRVLVGLHYVGTKKNKRTCTFLVMKPFKTNDKFAYHLYPLVSRKMSNALHLRGLRKFTVKQERHEKFAELQPEDIQCLNYQILPINQVDGIKADDLVANMLRRLNLSADELA